MPLAKKYQSQPEVLASYSYTDIAAGTGMQFFYLAHEKDSVGDDYFLTENSAVKSSLQYVDMDGLTSDLDYDLIAFNTPRTIKGTAILNIPWTTNSDAAASYVGTLVFDVIIAKLNGAETPIATITTETRTKTSTTTGWFNNGYFCVQITIPQTHFKKGEILRLTLQGTATRSNSNLHVNYGNDPSDRDYGIGVNSQAFILIPFVLDL